MLTLPDLDIAARTLWGEARGEADEGMEAVMVTIVNRWRSPKFRLDATLSGTCQRPKQFSCWKIGRAHV